MWSLKGHLAFRLADRAVERAAARTHPLHLVEQPVNSTRKATSVGFHTTIQQLHTTFSRSRATRQAGQSEQMGHNVFIEVHEKE